LIFSSSDADAAGAVRPSLAQSILTQRENGRSLLAELNVDSIRAQLPQNLLVE